MESALAEEVKQRASSFISGLLRYVDAPYTRKVQEPLVIWQKGNTRLLDYGAMVAGDHGDRPVVLFVPSLINRYYILDLEEDRSLLRFLSQQGVYPLVLDWGKPGDFEESFGCEDYVTQVLNAAIAYIADKAKQKIILAGYCMGGVLTLAATRLQSRYVSALALFATPWNFSCKEYAPFVMDNKWHATIDSMISAHKQLPADIIQSMFYMTDPWLFEQKFRRFADLQEDSRAAKNFISLERWVNDGVPMTAQVARDCLLGWAQRNDLANIQWKVAGKCIDPRKIKIPTFMAIPRNDHVVPQSCAAPLAEIIPHATVIHPSSGHVSMMVGSTAKRELWVPFLEWVKKL